jgi:phosphomannomutase
MSEPDRELLARAQAWLDDDPDAATRAELAQLIAARDLAALGARFAAPLAFGTAGLRGELGAGPARMNRALVARASAGVCAALAAEVADATRRGLCIGFDARHGSREFAEETAAVAAGFGFRVHVFERPGPTPLLAFAVRDCNAAGGVMVTASHNPARDNGYKVYWENGAQIVPPRDAQIAAAMLAVPSVLGLARVGAAERRARGLEQPLGAELEARYLAGVRALTASAPSTTSAGVPAPYPLAIAYTALHGVGERLLRAALAQAGFTHVASVTEQAEPDPDFPTVAFPNPEEPGAMDRVLALGERVQAGLAIANDPDADRLALAARDAGGRLRMLTGNQVGVLLAEYLLAQPAPEGAGPALVLSSLVSTPMIAAVARAHAADWEPTLTGFKWICNRALQLERERGMRFVFGFEEALGYSAGTLVRDKDGIASAVIAARLCAQLAAQGRTLFDLLAELYRRHGLYLSGQLARRMPADEQQRLMRKARAQPPAELAGLALRAAIDLQSGAVTGAPSFRVELPASDALIWELEGGHRICIRPSGTEPKLKLYVDVREPMQAGEPVSAAEARANATLSAVADALRAYTTAA